MHIKYSLYVLLSFVCCSLATRDCPSPVSSRLTQRNGNIPAFELHFDCSVDAASPNPSPWEELDSSALENITNAFLDVFEILENSLNISQTIVVLIGYFPTESGAIVQTESIKHHRNIENGVVRIFPQALLKQLDDNMGENTYGPYDLFMTFDPDALFYFPSEGPAKSDDEYNFVIVVLHEMLHGLGWMSTWGEQPFELEFPPGYNYDGEITETLFDKYLVDNKNGKSLQLYSRVFAEYVASLEADEDDIPFDENLVAMHKAMYEYAIQPYIFSFVLPDGRSFLLESSAQSIEKGTSMRHFDMSHITTDTALMTANEWKGKIPAAVSEIIRNKRLSHNLISIMGALGYSTVTVESDYSKIINERRGKKCKPKSWEKSIRPRSRKFKWTR